MRVLVIVLLVVAGCTPQPHASRSQSANLPQLNVSEIQSWIPTNALVADVGRIMEQHGFDCMVLTNLPDGSGSVLCSRVYSNTAQSVCLAIAKDSPVFCYVKAIGTPVPPNKSLQPTATAPSVSTNK